MSFDHSHTVTVESRKQSADNTTGGCLSCVRKGTNGTDMPDSSRKEEDEVKAVMLSHSHSVPNVKEDQVHDPQHEHRLTEETSFASARSNRHTLHNDHVDNRKHRNAANESDYYSVLINSSLYPPQVPVEWSVIQAIADEQVKAKSARFDVSLYASKKSAASGLMDLALLMANASQLKHVVLTGTRHQFYHLMMVMLCLSVFLQLVIGIALLFLARQRITEYPDDDESAYKRNKRANLLNNLVLCAILILTMLNVFISAFGLDSTPMTHTTAVTQTGT